MGPQHYIASVLVFSTLYNTPRFFEWRTWSNEYVRPCMPINYGKIFIKQKLAIQSVNQQTYNNPDDYNTSYLNVSEDYLQPEDLLVSQDTSNCSEIVRNVTLVATSLRRNHTYVLVIKISNFFNYFIFNVTMFNKTYESFYQREKILQLEGEKCFQTTTSNSSLSYKVR